MFTEYTLGFAFDDNAELVALIRKERPEWQAGLLNGIGGHMEEDERPIDTQVREFEEETGLFVPHEEWHNFGTMTGDDWIVHCFVAYNIPVHELQTLTDEEITVIEADSMFEAAEDWVPNLQWLVPYAQQYRDLEYDVELMA